MNSENHADNDATRISPADVNNLQQSSRANITKEAEKQDLDSATGVSAGRKEQVADNEAATIVSKNLSENISKPVSTALKIG